MKACTFFGHRHIYENIDQKLTSLITELVIKKSVNLFYVGNNGSFDNKVIKILRDLSDRYKFAYFIVLAYIPTKNTNVDFPGKTIVPDCIETAPKRFAIIKRNSWMIDRSDYVITYVKNDISSGAARAKRTAIKRGKTVFELYEEKEAPEIE